MVWFFERSGSFIRCETPDPTQNPNRYELVIVDAGGNERVERFNNSDELEARRAELHIALQVDGWHGPFGRFL